MWSIKSSCNTHARGLEQNFVAQNCFSILVELHISQSTELNIYWKSENCLQNCSRCKTRAEVYLLKEGEIMTRPIGADFNL